MILNRSESKYKTSEVADQFYKPATVGRDRFVEWREKKNINRNTTVFQRLQREGNRNQHEKTDQNADIEGDNLE